MQKLKEKINTLESFGIKLNGTEITPIEKILALYEPESDEYPEYWLIIRELGGVDFNSPGSEHLSNNLSTIVYEDFLSIFPPSYILKELERISNGAFKYSIVTEFVWDHTYFSNPDANKALEYNVNGKDLKYQYVPYKRDFGTLNAEWLFQLLNDLHEYLYELNINYQINDDSVTFMHISRENQNKLIAANIGVGVNLIPALME